MDVNPKNIFQVFPVDLLNQVNGGCGARIDDSEPNQDGRYRACIHFPFDIPPRPRIWTFIKYEQSLQDIH